MSDSSSECSCEACDEDREILAKRQRTEPTPFTRLVTQQTDTDRRELTGELVIVPSSPPSETEAEILAETPTLHRDINHAIRHWLEPRNLTEFSHIQPRSTTIAPANPEQDPRPYRLVPPGLQVQEDEDEQAYEARMAAGH